MCTSFVAHSDRTYIGMNFDISPRPIKLTLKGNNQLIVMQQEDGRFLPAFGLNGDGTFMNLQMVQPSEEGKYRRGKNTVHIIKLFEAVLDGKIALSSLGTYLEENTIVNVPNFSLHSLVAGKGYSYVIEPGQGNTKNGVPNNFCVLTNFSLRKQNDRAEEWGQARYNKAYEMLSAKGKSFNKDVGFSILKETAQREGNFPTQLSLVYIPEDKIVYFTLNADFDSVYEYSFIDNEVRMGVHNSCTLSKKGVLLSELETWLEMKAHD